MIKFSKTALAAAMIVMMAGCSTLTTVKDDVKAIKDDVKAKIHDKTAPKESTTAYRSTADILKDAPANAWYRLSQDNLVYMTLNNGKVVVFELADEFAPEHAKQIRHFAKTQYWDGLTIYRVQDNYVAQFGSFDYATETNTKPFPEGTKALPAEFTKPAASVAMTTLKDKEAYSDGIGFSKGFPVAIKGDDAFLVHCYGMVGAARMDAPDSSKGSELYVMIGQPARHLDRQIVVVGRVVHGIEHLSTLPRGTGSMGFYEKNQAPMGIKSVRLGSQLPPSEQIQFEAIANDSSTFRELIEARRHMQGSWFAAPMSGGMGVCDVRQTIRVVEN